MAEAARANQRIARAGNRGQFQFVDEGRIRSNLMSRFAFMAKAKFRRHKNDPLRTDFHSLQCVLPAFHSAVAAREKMLIAVEFLSIDEITAISDNDQIVGGWFFPCAFLNDAIL